MTEKIKITFLGTSPQIPTAKRNHSAILLNYKDENILFDCGEGTQRQFRKAKLNPCKITKILISHWHGDHVLGLPGLLQTLSSSEYNKHLEIYGPKGIKERIESVLKLYSIKLNFGLSIREIIPKKEGVFNFFENDSFVLQAARMDHGPPCNAYSFVEKDKLRIDKKKLAKSGILGPLIKKLVEGKDIEFNGKKFKSKQMTYLEKGRKVCFVFDTKNNSLISKIAKDSDIFICETSFTKDREDFAREYKHMTTKQVAENAKKAKVKKLFLIHLSSRNNKNPKKILTEVQKIFKNSIAVKDLDSVELK